MHRTGTLRRVKAVLLTKTRVAYTDSSFAEIVVWEVPHPLKGSAHSYKCRLAFVVEDVCVLRYDNESGKGDHRHTLDGEARYRFLSIDKLFADFERDIRRFMDENRNA
jgi:hypothetical protein